MTRQGSACVISVAQDPSLAGYPSRADNASSCLAQVFRPSDSQFQLHDPAASRVTEKSAREQ